MPKPLDDIRADLQTLTGDSFFVECLRRAEYDPNKIDHIEEAIALIVEQAQDNRAAVERQIGADLLEKIEYYVIHR